jgi:hypothetical protein
MKKRITFGMVKSSLDINLSNDDQNLTDVHSRSTCPLCLLFDQSTNKCKKCLNYVFDSINDEIPSSYTPCAKRCITYSKLSYYQDVNKAFFSSLSLKNNVNISKFWQEVKDGLINKGLKDEETFVVIRHKKLILGIAEKYK